MKGKNQINRTLRQTLPFVNVNNSKSTSIKIFTLAIALLLITIVSASADNVIFRAGNIEADKNATATYFIGNGSLLTGIISQDTWWSINEKYIYNNSNNLDFNETKLNSTIDDRDTDTTYSSDEIYINKNGSNSFIFNETKLNQTIDVKGSDTLYYSDEIYINKNSSNYFIFNETKNNATIDARDSDTTYSENSDFLTLVANVFGFNVTLLNQTIDARDTNTWWGLNEGYIVNNSNSLDFNETKLNTTIDNRNANTHVSGDNIYLYNNSNTMFFNETKANLTIDLIASNYNETTWIKSQNYLTNGSNVWFTTLNVTGTSYLENLIINAENISVDNIIPLTGNEVIIKGDLNITGNALVNNTNVCLEDGTNCLVNGTSYWELSGNKIITKNVSNAVLLKDSQSIYYGNDSDSRTYWDDANNRLNLDWGKSYRYKIFTGTTSMYADYNNYVWNPSANNAAYFYGGFDGVINTGNKYLTGWVYGRRAYADNQNSNYLTGLVGLSNEILQRGGRVISASGNQIKVNLYTNTTDNVYGVNSYISLQNQTGTGKTASAINAYGIASYIRNTGQGTLNNAYNFRSSTPQNSGNGTYTNYYSFYADDATSAGITNSWGVYVVTDKSYFGGNVGIELTTPTYPLEIANNIGGISLYSSANISAEGFIDRTPSFDGNGITTIKNIRSLKGEIDHSSLPSIARVQNIKKPVYREEIIQHPATDTNFAYNETVKVLDHYDLIEGRSLGGMISVNVKALQEIITENEMIKKELCKKDNTYSWC